MRESVEQPLPDRSQYRLGLLQHLPIVETQHGEAGSFERPRSALIRVQCIGLEVLAPIEFNDQTGLRTGKVGDVPCHGVLAAELKTCQAAVSQAAPKQALSVGACGAQVARMRPHPGPLPQAGAGGRQSPRWR